MDEQEYHRMMEGEAVYAEVSFTDEDLEAIANQLAVPRPLSHAQLVQWITSAVNTGVELAKIEVKQRQVA